MKLFKKNKKTITTDNLLESGKIPVRNGDSDCDYVYIKVEDIVKAIELYKASEENK